jgi:uncharacterized protein with GYD domain
MAKYLVQARYTSDGVKGLLKDGGSGRRDAVAKLIESLGGKMDSACQKSPAYRAPGA